MRNARMIKKYFMQSPIVRKKRFILFPFMLGIWFCRKKTPKFLEKQFFHIRICDLVNEIDYIKYHKTPVSIEIDFLIRIVKMHSEISVCRIDWNGWTFHVIRAAKGNRDLHRNMMPGKSVYIHHFQIPVMKILYVCGSQIEKKQGYEKEDKSAQNVLHASENDRKKMFYGTPFRLAWHW